MVQTKARRPAKGMRILAKLEVKIFQRGDVNTSSTGNLMRKIDAEIAVTNARAAELSLYRMWATHRLVPDAHIGLLMNLSRDGGVQ
jgi:hypothetical protein